MFIVFLLLIIVLLAVACFILFHHKMVDLHAWHTFLSTELTAAKGEIAKLRQWVNDHAHLHTAPPTASPAATAATTNK